MSFGQTLKELRNEKQLTQQELGYMLNLSKANVSKYESNTLEPNIETIQIISRIFNVSSDYLLGLSNVPNNTVCEVAKNTTTQSDNAFADEMYSTLVDIGFIDDGEEITDKHLEVLTKILAPQIDYAKFELSLKKLEDENSKNDK